ncbi:MAG: thiol oxidoreductase [Bacteroidetes bacterium]|nr:thiol oxidoreductase [Bacteroidota bacterium]
MKKYVVYLGIISIAAILLAESCRKPEELTDDQYNEWLSGGSQTVFNTGSGAFGSQFAGMSARGNFNHEVGDAAFGSTFVSAPAPVHQGLGPVFNSVSCSSCHVSDGRGKPPGPGEQMVSMLFRVSIPGEDEHGGPMPAPGFGGQLQQRAIAGSTPEATIGITYTYQTYFFPDGQSYELRTPTYMLQTPYCPVPAGMMLSPRVAPPVFGLGLLEAIPEWALLAHQDVNDADHDGISGKANYVWNVLKNDKSIGRFGWKAGNPTLLQQSAGAYNQDMGITNFIFNKESCEGQTQYQNLDDEPEVSDSLLYAVAFYMQTLSVPGRRMADDAEVKRGKQIFTQAKCSSCHVPMYKTDVNVAFREVSNQTIFPYTDLLLHDMGAGLADNRPDNLADGNEWKTPPLWGIGLTQVVNGHNNFLHDGRARSFIEAIMWHGGEAAPSAQFVANLSTDDRNALLKFLGSL